MDMSSGREAPTPGAQLVRRVATLIRVVGSAMPGGIGTSEIARGAGLSRPTTHRILTSLAAEGFVDRDSERGRWYLGPELFLMGTVAAERYEISTGTREAVRTLAALTAESAFFSVRRGDETVCLVREEGPFPIRSHVLFEGVRFPLGVASAGLAILAFLPDAEIDDYLATHDLASRYGSPHTATSIRARITVTREAGYAVNPGLIVEGSWGMGAAVFDATGRPIGALSLTGIESRFAPNRRCELGRILMRHAHAISREMGFSPRLR